MVLADTRVRVREKGSVAITEEGKEVIDKLGDGVGEGVIVGETGVAVGERGAVVGGRGVAVGRMEVGVSVGREELMIKL